jgi:hypothetical protein
MAEVGRHLGSPKVSHGSAAHAVAVIAEWRHSLALHFSVTANCVNYLSNRFCYIVGGFEIHVVSAVNDDLFAVPRKQNKFGLALFAFSLHLRGGDVGMGIAVSAIGT